MTLVIAVHNWKALVWCEYRHRSIVLFMFLITIELPLNQKAIAKSILFWNSYSCRWKLTLDSILLVLLDVNLRKMIGTRR